MGDYYDPHPLLQLRQPVVLAGVPGARHRQVAHAAAARTGISFADLDRWIEHEAGASLWDLVAARGEAALREIEARLLERALRTAPPSIIALGDTTLLEQANRERIDESATLVHVHLDLAGAYWQIRRHEETHGRGWSPFVPSPVEDIAELRPLFQRLEPVLAGARLRLEAAGRHPSELATELIEHLRADHNL
ncbi:MAG: hypothetical protein KDD11_14350 [Acidobacteria bacterium]|nr:hypothetical protein [Acidobacteriota bacterium]